MRQYALSNHFLIKQKSCLLQTVCIEKTKSIMQIVNAGALIKQLLSFRLSFDSTELNSNEKTSESS